MTTDLWTHYNELILSPDTERLRKLLVRAELFKQTLTVPGDIVECGVFKGTGLLYWLKLLQIYSPAARKKVIGFDTFSGFGSSLLPYEQVAADAYVKEANLEGANRDAVMERVKAAGYESKADLVEGDITETALLYVAANPGFRISLLHIDIDTYAGTRAALEAFYPAVARNGIVVLDEYADRGWGESDAVDEFLADRHVHVLAIPHSSRPTSYFVKT